MRRAANRVLSFLLGAALVVAGLVALVDGLRVAADRDTWILDADHLYAEGTTTQLGDDVVLVTCVLTALAGLAVLALQLWRRPPPRLPIAAPVQEPGTTWAADADPLIARWWLARRGGERRLHDVAQTGTEVERARVRLRRRRRQWRAHVVVTLPQNTARLDGEVTDPTEEVADRVRAELDALAATGVDVRTRVLTPRGPRD